MKLRNTILYIWVILAGIAPILTFGLKNGIIALATDIIINIVIWYLIIKIIFFIYDKFRRKNKWGNE